MGTTIDQLAYNAYRDAGIVKTEGTILSPDQTEEFRQVYNRMVDAWAADGFTVSHVARLLFPITPNKGDYTIGPGADWDVTPCPNQIERASVLLTTFTPSPEYPLTPLTLDEWQGWTLKTQATTWSRRFYYERPGQVPLNGMPNSSMQGTVHLVYVPTEADQIVLYLEQPLSQIDSTGDTELIFPNGYQMAIESNLAVHLAARYPAEAQLSQDTRANAVKSLALIKMNNDRPLQRTCDWVVGQRRSNVYLGNRYQG